MFLKKNDKKNDINKVPYFDIAQNSDIITLNQTERVWMNHSQINLLAEHIYKELGQSDKNFFVSNVPFNLAKENINGFVLTFMKPLTDFHQRVEKSKNFGGEKFSAVLNLGDKHWTSLTLVPSSTKGKAYVIYRDSFGAPMPDVLKDSLSLVYKDLVIGSSKESIQKDSHSCGIFAVLASVGDKRLSNSSIISSFVQKEKDAIADLDSKILQEAKKFSQEYFRAKDRRASLKNSRENSRENSI